ncbi:hypothetical protein ACA910_016007 [Epithemia clementina (nom. ined.)]
MPEPTKQKKSRPKRNEALIPAWWMEVTPHYTLDLEDEKARREMEERMALYYAQLAEQEASKGMMFDIDGNPIEEGTGASGGVSGDWKSNWTGRKKKDGSTEEPPPPEKPKMFGGRNFKPGSSGWDPKQWGIDANDPDYDQYLSGAMLPPQFISAMNNFAKATGHYQVEDYASNLRSSEGAYGRLAEKQAHIPDWMKKKLRSTTQGHSIRTGQYDDSPNRHWKSKDAAAEEGGEQQQQQQQQHPEEEQQQQQPPQQPQAPPSPTSTPTKFKPSPPPPNNRFSPKTTRKPLPEEKHAPVPKPFSHKDFYYNSTTPHAGKAAANGTKAAAAPPPESAPPKYGRPQQQQQQQQQPFMDPDAAEYEEEEEYIEEVEELVVYEDEEEVIEEEVVEEYEDNQARGGRGGGGGDLEDLQAKLASKMEELKRLQAM